LATRTWLSRAGSWARHLRRAERVEERDGLRGAEGEGEARHARPARRGNGELLAVGRAASQNGAQVLGRHLALQAEPLGAGQPDAGRLAGAQVMVLDAGRHGLEVGVAAGGELADAEHPHGPSEGPRPARGGTEKAASEEVVPPQCSVRPAHEACKCGDLWAI